MSFSEVIEKMGIASDTIDALKSDPMAVARTAKLSKTLHDFIGPQEELCPELATYCFMIDGLGPCIKHPLYFSVPHMPQLNGMANRGLATKKKMLAKYRAAKEWGGFLAAHEKPYRFEALEEIAGELTRDQFWELFADVYIGCENWYEPVNRELIEGWLEDFYNASRGALRRQSIRQAAMEKGEHKAYRKLPNKLRVFRGFSRDGGERGYSWSLNSQKAAWFAGRLAEHDNKAGYAYVAWGWCLKGDALGYFTRRSEDEIFCDWRNVKVSSVDIVRFANRDSEEPDVRPVVSFDFDGTLHSDTNGDGHPLSFWRADLTPRRDVLRKLKAAARTSRVVIVTRRDYGDLGPVLRFCGHHRLPVATVYPTYDKPKEPYLAAIKAVAHYDDQAINHPGAVQV